VVVCCELSESVVAQEIERPWERSIKAAGSGLGN
jgi:hypothetical protein